MPLNSSASLPNAELRVLSALWEHGASTIRRLSDAVYPGGKHSSYATVQRLLDRLEESGYVARDRSAMTHVFIAAVSREQLIGDQLRVVAERLCGGSFAPLLAHLLKTETLPDDRKELRKLLNSHRPPRG